MLALQIFLAVIVALRSTYLIRGVVLDQETSSAAASFTTLFIIAVDLAIIAFITGVLP